VSVVVRRCPNCGSVQDEDGPCEVCHEAEVRWFCANHTPGRWLDGPACAACGATATTDPTAAPRPTRPVERPSERPSERPIAPRPGRPPVPPYVPPYAPYAPPPEPEVEPTRRRPPRPAWAEDPLPRPDVLPTARPGLPIDPAAVLGRAVRAGLPSAIGCVGRLVFVALLLLALLAAAFAYVVWY
jgi:hypothetical protein